MPRDTRRSGVGLLLAALAGIVFFWFSDAKAGLSRPFADVDLVNQSTPGTYIGLIGCAAIALIGLWLVLRRAT